MKKVLTTLFCLSVMAVGTQSVMAADSNSADVKQKSDIVERKAPPKFGPGGEHKPPMLNLEEELNLTEEQKQQARQNRINGRKEMKPIMDEIRNKRESVLDIMDSDLSEAEKQEKLKTIQAELKELHKKANGIRERNMESFEKTLTKEQKAKFEKIKQKHMPKKECKSCSRMMPPEPIE